MSENDFHPGSIRRLDDVVEGQLQRIIEHPPADVWRMLTEPQRLAQWLAPGSVELRRGGAVRIDFADSGTLIESTVRALEPGHLLEYSWSSGSQPERPLRWTLDAVERGTQLTLTVRLPADEDIAKACAGFEGHLEMLVAALEGVPVHFPVELYLQARKAYQAMLAA
ncbi:SRPBCC family protein [Castellaniella sp. MT123]|uniref:SRPBCC family protein n=1 Tax=Castellaniella sp. MT123 TaxID=3140381 RepID=UPI0031F36D6E|nr:SRPBCC family protein [Castellaniella sp.]